MVVKRGALYPYSAFWTEWRAAFTGLQIFFGYESDGWPSSWMNNTMFHWISYWADSNNPHSFRDAYFNAIEDYLYNQGGYGIKPAILTSTDANGDDYCDKTYAESTSEAGGRPTMKIAMEFGIPSYN